MDYLKFDAVSKKYHYSQFPVFENLTFCVQKNSTTTLLVDRQSGKTTICKLILSTEKPDSGKITLNGKNISDIKNADKRIAYLCPQLLLFENKTVFSNLRFPLKIRKVSASQQKQIATKTAQEFGITDILFCKVKKLTFQQKLCVVLARLTVREVDMVLVDGLLDGLEGFLANSVLTSLSKLNATVVVLSSDINRAKGEVVLIVDGKVVCTGDVEKARKFKQNVLWLFDSMEEQNGIQK